MAANHVRASILVIDDDPLIQQMLRDILAIDDYAAILAASAAEGLHLLRVSNPTPVLIISDLLLPDMDGLELFQQVRAHPLGQHIPCIFLSGSRDHLRIARTQAGTNGESVAFLLKLFGVPELLDAVARGVSAAHPL